nr:PREDICTED: transducin-like enhancer protein 1 isoform X3 [Latimeria chalumnae]|eukprot:XP_014345989.1 PREDICTED: transducin-like enhancer protein 1 isoform X3 [Latimeria chalumnae]
MFPQNRPATHLQPPPVSAAAAAAAVAATASGTPPSLKLTYLETLDRIKEEFQFLQSQYHSLKLECEKLATEKTEIQRHYVMYYEMSYGLNIEMHKQTEIAKRLNVICAQLIPFLSQEHQLQAQHLSHHAPPIPLTPHASGLQPHGIASISGSSGLLALSGALGTQAQLAIKEERSHLEVEHHRDREPGPSSIPLPNGDKGRPSSEYMNNGKRRKGEEKDFMTDYGSDADKSEDNLVVDEDPSSPHSVQSYSSRENGVDKSHVPRKETGPGSPTSMASSSGASPQRNKEPQMVEKSSTPGLKPSTPMSQGEATTPGSSNTPQFRPVPGKSGVDSLALGLRNPLSVQGSYPGAFAMAHPGVNGEMAGAGAYASMHLVSQQINGAAAAAAAVNYGRSPVVGYESHPHMRVPGLPASMQSATSGKPYVLANSVLHLKVYT